MGRRSRLSRGFSPWPARSLPSRRQSGHNIPIAPPIMSDILTTKRNFLVSLIQRSAIEGQADTAAWLAVQLSKLSESLQLQTSTEPQVNSPNKQHKRSRTRIIAGPYHTLPEIRQIIVDNYDALKQAVGKNEFHISYFRGVIEKFMVLRPGDLQLKRDQLYWHCQLCAALIRWDSERLIGPANGHGMYKFLV